MSEEFVIIPVTTRIGCTDLIPELKDAEGKIIELQKFEVTDVYEVTIDYKLERFNTEEEAKMKIDSLGKGELNTSSIVKLFYNREDFTVNYVANCDHFRELKALHEKKLFFRSLRLCWDEILMDNLDSAVLNKYLLKGEFEHKHIIDCLVVNELFSNPGEVETILSKFEVRNVTCKIRKSENCDLTRFKDNTIYNILELISEYDDTISCGEELTCFEEVYVNMKFENLQSLSNVYRNVKTLLISDKNRVNFFEAFEKGYIFNKAETVRINDPIDCKLKPMFPNAEFCFPWCINAQEDHRGTNTVKKLFDLRHVIEHSNYFDKMVMELDIHKNRSEISNLNGLILTLTTSNKSKSARSF